MDDGRTGLLFRAGDTTDLAHKIERALASDDDLENMGRAARAKYESRYTGEKNYRRLMEIYERVISARGRTVRTAEVLDEPYSLPRGVASV